MFGSRARVFAERVMSTAEMSSLMPFKFWMSLARLGPPMSQPNAPPKTRAAISPQRASCMQFLRLHGGHISNRKCNDNQHGGDHQHIAHDAVFARLARPGRALDDPSP